MGFLKKIEQLRLRRLEKKVKKEMEKWDNIKIVRGEADKKTLKESVVIEIGGYDQEALKRDMDEYNAKYGKLPDKFYDMPIEKLGEYLRDLMKKYEKKGINTLAEIEGLVKERKPFKGSNSQGIIDKGSYKICVSDNLIYDSKNDFFDCQYKHLKIYSEIQHIIAKAIYGKELAVIRKEYKKKQKSINPKNRYKKT